MELQFPEVNILQEQILMGYFTSTNNGQTWESPPPSSIGAIIQSGNNLLCRNN